MSNEEITFSGSIDENGTLSLIAWGKINHLIEKIEFYKFGIEKPMIWKEVSDNELHENSSV